MKEQKKQEAGKVVQMYMTKSQIIGLGASREANGKRGRWAWVALFALMILTAIALVNSIEWLWSTGLVLMVVCILGWQWRCSNMGKRLWKSVADKEEPIKL